MKGKRKTEIADGKTKKRTQDWKRKRKMIKTRKRKVKRNK